MVSFAKLMKPHVIAAVPERFWVQGTRTNCSTGESKIIGCQFEVQQGTHGKVLQIVDGGVTGYESFYISGYKAPDLIVFSGLGHWLACAGTKDRWDELLIDAENMNALRVWAKGKL